MTKNGAFVGRSSSTLVYDQDLGFFKVITGGNIAMTFKTSRVFGSQVYVTGTLSKKHHVTIGAKFPSGDEYTMDFAAPNQGAAAAAKE